MRTILIRSAFARHKETLEASERIIPDIERAAKILVAALRRRKKVLICGNGGSAADAQHFAAEFTGRYKKERGPLPGIALTVDTSTLTAIGNDYGFEKVFTRQVEALGMKGDVLVAFTTSGSSKNVLAAIAEARRRGMKVIALTGEKGSRLRRITDSAIIVPSTETARIQEVHELVYHAWCEYIDAHLAA